MKIAFDDQIFTYQRYGGVSRYFVELASRLPAHEVQVSVVAPLHINNYLAAAPARDLTDGRYVPYAFGDWVVCFRQCHPVLQLANRVIAPIAWRGVQPDIVHETHYAVKPVGKARRRVVTIYDMTHDLFSNEIPFAPRWIAAKRAAVKRADHVICISENTRQDLVRLYDIDPARTTVVHLGHSLSIEGDGTESQISRGRPSLLYVGQRAGYKNFITLLRAYASSKLLKEFELIAFGGSPPLPGEQSELTQLGITDRVRFESGSDRELAAHYQAAAAFIYPSKYEGFGIPPLEAMSYGCPVVCSNGGSIPEVVGDAGAYFDPQSVEELRAAIERVVTTEALQTDLRNRGYRRIGEFSWDKCAAETAQVYRQII